MILWMGLIVIQIGALLFITAVICGSRSYTRVDDLCVQRGRQHQLFAAEFEWVKRRYEFHAELLKMSSGYATQFIGQLTDRAFRDARKSRIGYPRLILLAALVIPLLLGRKLMSLPLVGTSVAAWLAKPVWRRSLIGLILSPYVGASKDEGVPPTIF